MLDPANEWTIIWISKTLFTPEGVDIISWLLQLPVQTLNHIGPLTAETFLLFKHLTSLRLLTLPNQLGV